MKKISRENAVAAGVRVLKHTPGVLKCSPVGNQDGWHSGVELEMMRIVKQAR